jgi:hypothetical protein
MKLLPKNLLCIIHHELCYLKRTLKHVNLVIPQYHYIVNYPDIMSLVKYIVC